MMRRKLKSRYVDWVGVQIGMKVRWHTSTQEIIGTVVTKDTRVSVTVLGLDNGEEIRVWKRGTGSRIEVLESREQPEQ